MTNAQIQKKKKTDKTISVYDYEGTPVLTLSYPKDWLTTQQAFSNHRIELRAVNRS